MTSIAREVVMKVTRTLSLSWACAQQMVPGPLVVAVLSFSVSLCFYLCMSLFSCLLLMTKECNDNKTKQFSLNKILNAEWYILDSWKYQGILVILTILTTFVFLLNQNAEVGRATTASSCCIMKADFKLDANWLLFCPNITHGVTNSINLSSTMITESTFFKSTVFFGHYLLLLSWLVH